MGRQTANLNTRSTSYRFLRLSRGLKPCPHTGFGKTVAVAA